MSGSRKRARFACRALLMSWGIFAISACNGRREAHAVAEAATPSVAKSLAKPKLEHRSQPQAPLEQFVQQQVEEADASGVRVLVYVGATWCEPCRRFHKSLESGELDDALAGTKFLEFDADRDISELRTAGYASKYIP